MITTGRITIEEIRSAEDALWNNHQVSHFAETLQTFRKQSNVPVKYPLKKLNPFIGTNGLMRVEGRLTNAHLPYASKHPIILHGSSQLVKMTTPNVFSLWRVFERQIRTFCKIFNSLLYDILSTLFVEVENLMNNIPLIHWPTHSQHTAEDASNNWIPSLSSIKKRLISHEDLEKSAAHGRRILDTLQKGVCTCRSSIIVKNGQKKGLCENWRHSDSIWLVSAS